MDEPFTQVRTLASAPTKLDLLSLNIFFITHLLPQNGESGMRDDSVDNEYDIFRCTARNFNRNKATFF